MLLSNLLSHIKGTPGYTFRTVRKKGKPGSPGKSWVQGMPNDAMVDLHRWIVFELTNEMAHQELLFPHATCFLGGGSIQRNVQPHLKNRYYYVTDIHDAYGSVDTDRLVNVLCSVFPKLVNELDVVRSFLLQYCMYCPKNSDVEVDCHGAKGLMVGAPASPFLFNLFAGTTIDRPLHTLCEENGIAYTRYLDDLTFSRHHRKITGNIRKEIRRIISDAGLSVSHHKSAVVDLEKQSLLICGLRLQRVRSKDYTRVSATREYLKRLEGLFHRVLSGNAPDVTVNHVRGYLNFINFASRKMIRSRLQQEVQRLGLQCLKRLQQKSD